MAVESRPPLSRTPTGTSLTRWDSTAEVRYLVIPQRPAGTEHLGEEELAALVSRDSMIGTRLADAPGQGSQP